MGQTTRSEAPTISQLTCGVLGRYENTLSPSSRIYLRRL